MNIPDFQKYLDEVIQVLDETRDKEAEIIGQDLTAVVRDRVQNDKVQADGSSFGKYSQAVVPYWFYQGKGRVSNAEQKILDRYGYFASYADFREVNNLQSQEIDLTFTGAMWSSAGVQEVEQKEGISTAIISFKGESNQLKAGYHSERWGNILTPNEAEINAAFEGYQERRIELIEELFS